MGQFLPFLYLNYCVAANQMDHSIDFPQSFKVTDDLTITLDHMKEHHIEEVYHILRTYGEAGQGICQYEFKSLEDFKERFWQKSDMACVGTDKNGAMEFAMNCVPSTLCRSSKPAFHHGYVVKHPNSKVTSDCATSRFAG